MARMEEKQCKKESCEGYPVDGPADVPYGGPSAMLIDDNDAWVKITTTATVTSSTLTTTLTSTSTVSTTSLSSTGITSSSISTTSFSVTETTRTSTTYTRTFIGPTTTSTFTSLTTQTSTKSTTTITSTGTTTLSATTVSTTTSSTRTATTTTIPPKFLDSLNISRWWRCEENFTQENLMQNEPEYLGKHLALAVRSIQTSHRRIRKLK